MSDSTADASARRRSAEKGRGRTGPARPRDTVTDEPRQSSFVRAFLAPRDGLQSRDRTPPIHDQHRRAAPKAVDQGAQVVLGLGYAGFFHRAKMAVTNTPIKSNPYLGSMPAPGAGAGRSNCR